MEKNTQNMAASASVHPQDSNLPPPSTVLNNGNSSSNARTSNNGADTSNSNLSPSGEQTISYSAERIIGNGSFGVVFQAKVVETGEVVAIKKVLQDKRFKNRELQIMRQLVKDPHSNIVALKHCFYSQVGSFLVMIYKGRKGFFLIYLFFLYRVTNRMKSISI